MSLRTGRVCWLNKDAAPQPYRGEAAMFATESEAITAFAELEATLVRIVGRCAWRREIVPATVRE